MHDPSRHLHPKEQGMHFQHPAVSYFVGIGKSIAHKLASQGLNVVLVALQDAALDDTHAELTRDYPNVTIRKASTHSCTRHA